MFKCNTEKKTRHLSEISAAQIGQGRAHKFERERGGAIFDDQLKTKKKASRLSTSNLPLEIK